MYNGTMAEIGCYAGESTEIFLKYGNWKKIVAIDSWQNGYDDKDKASWKSDMSQVEKTFDLRIQGTCVEKVKGLSSESAHLFEDKTFDFVYIDACHTYQAVKEDITAWYPKVKDGSFIGGHDVDWPEVNKAILEVIGSPLKTFSDNSWVLQKR